ncbi:hypothetical protein JCM3766R1_006897 [Sporobolomyces carnicolor]
MALGLLELVILVIRCIVEEFKDLYDQRKSYSSWFWRNNPFALLPLELVAEIVEALDSDKVDHRESNLFRQSTLASCSRTSHALFRYAQPQLLRQPYLTHNLAGFERTILASPRRIEQIEHITLDLRDDTIPSVECDPATRIVSMLTSPKTRSIGLMEVRKVGIRELARVPQLERLHLHMMNYANNFDRFSPPPTPFVNLTSLSLSAIHLPHHAGDSSPVSELYTPEMLPNLTALEIDECCVRIVSKVNTFPRLRYLALRCSCARCVPELRLQESLLAPLELFELNPHPYFLEYFRYYSNRLPRFKRLRISSEFARFRSPKTAIFILEILIDALRFYPSSTLRDVVHLYLPRYWAEYESDQVHECCVELMELATEKKVEVDFNVEDEGSRMNRATKAAGFVSDFWLLVDEVKARRRIEAAGAS